MKNICIAGLALVLSLVAFAACQNDSSKNNSSATEAAVPGTQYICPMNCEKGKTYDQPGSCPVCNMDLEPSKAEVEANKAEYFIEFSAKPAQLTFGHPAVLSFTPKMKGNDSAPVPLDLVHEKKMHLILVSDDLSWFDHIHPEYQASGSYDIKVMPEYDYLNEGRSGINLTAFFKGGKYWAFADFKPTGGLNQVDKFELNVAGKPAKPITYAQEKTVSTVDDYTLTMETTGGFAAGAPQHIPLTVRQNGKVIDPATFENYLGEKAHLVLVEVASKEFVHTHPAVEGGKLDIHTTFAKPGTYRGWLQFQTGGVVHTADFVLKVGEGKVGEHKEGEAHSDH